MTGTRSRTDWLLFVALTLLWSGAYPMTRGAVETLPPELIVPSRITIGASVLLTVLFASGQRLPKLSQPKHWIAIAAMGIIGMAAPFLMITHAQETVDSSLAALYVSTTPIFVALGAHAFFKDERLTPQSWLGVMVGFIGVALLFGPDAIANFGSADVRAQGLLILATACYATSTLIARAAPEMPSLVFAAGFVTVGAVASWPLAIGQNIDALQPSFVSVLCLIGLGLGPSALASLLYMALVKRAGATFLSLTGYAIPVVSAIFGWILFRETLAGTAYVAFGLILLGVWLAQRTAKSR